MQYNNNIVLSIVSLDLSWYIVITTMPFITLISTSFRSTLHKLPTIFTKAEAVNGVFFQLKTNVNY